MFLQITGNSQYTEKTILIKFVKFSIFTFIIYDVTVGALMFSNPDRESECCMSMLGSFLVFPHSFMHQYISDKIIKEKATTIVTSVELGPSANY
jgi:hypothetical protein